MNRLCEVPVELEMDISLHTCRARALAYEPKRSIETLTTKSTRNYLIQGNKLPVRVYSELCTCKTCSRDLYSQKMSI